MSMIDPDPHRNEATERKPAPPRGHCGDCCFKFLLNLPETNNLHGNQDYCGTGVITGLSPSERDGRELLGSHLRAEAAE